MGSGYIHTLLLWSGEEMAETPAAAVHGLSVNPVPPAANSTDLLQIIQIDNGLNPYFRSI
jgi:hypothetical protein